MMLPSWSTRIATWALGVGAVVVGVFDLFAGGPKSSILLVVLGGAIFFELWRATGGAAALVEGAASFRPRERETLEESGYRIAAYPLTLLSAAARAMQDALDALGRGETPERRLSFERLREIVGFDRYDEARQRSGDGGSS